MADDKKADPSSEGRAVVQPATSENGESIEKEQEAVDHARKPEGLSDAEHYGARSGQQKEEGSRGSKPSARSKPEAGKPG